MTTATIIFGIILAVALVYILKKRKESKVATKLAKKAKPASQMVRPTIPEQPGFDEFGKPVKKDTETGPDFKAREAHYYYVHGRS